MNETGEQFVCWRWAEDQLSRAEGAEQVNLQRAKHGGGGYILSGFQGVLSAGVELGSQASGSRVPVASLEEETCLP